MAINLLKNTDAAALAPGKHHDGDGLYLDVRSATSASWLFKFTFGGKGDEVGLGSRKKVDADRARELRAWALAELGAGRNPKVSLKTQKLELIRVANAEPALSIYELAKRDVRAIAKSGLRGKAITADRVVNSWVRSLHSDFIGYVADMAPQDVTVEDVEPLMRRLYAEKPVLADDIRQRLSKVLTWAKAKDRAAIYFAKGWEHPVTALEATLDRGDHKKQSHPAMEPGDVGAFLAVLRDRDNHGLMMRLALEWHVISMTRPGEAAGCDWSEFQWDDNCWAIGADRMKMRRGHRVPLSDRHHEILDLILDGADAPASGPVFTVQGAAPVSVTGLRRVLHGCKKADGEAFVAMRKPGEEARQPSLHGFRGTFSTWARKQKHPVLGARLFDEAMIEECIAHVVGNSTRNDYIHDDFLDERRPLLEAWAKFCGTVQKSNVLPMRRRVAVAA